MNTVIRVARNPLGRDLAVGDVHGHFSRLRTALEAVDFDPSRDRLFSVGDLVDRGPESEEALVWLEQPWFHAVQGNHESLAISHLRQQPLDYTLYRNAGGAWFLDMPAAGQARYAERFALMPLAIEVETALGAVGILHADCPVRRWQDLLDLLAMDPVPASVQEVCQWSRTRLREQDTRSVDGLRALLVGHTTLERVKVLGNVWHLDTGGWSTGRFTLLDLATLENAQPIRPR